MPTQGQKITLYDTVQSGDNKGTGIVAANSMELKEVTGEEMYPGTLKVVFRHPVKLSPSSCLMCCDILKGHVVLLALSKLMVFLPILRKDPDVEALHSST